MKRGLFIVVESQDGGGKGTNSPKIVEYLRSKYGEDNVVQTKEPGGTPLGSLIREILFEKIGTRDLAEGVLDCLFLASHLQNTRYVVEPALADGKLVVSDRYWYSQLAYATQRKIPRQLATAYVECRGPSADLLLFLHGDSNVLTDRANSRPDETHQGQKAWNDVETLTKIQRAYFDLFSTLPEFNPICVDGKSPEQVWLEVKEAVDCEVELWEAANDG